MSGISFSGLGSGLPVDEIVKASVEARAQPLQKMQEERAEAQEKISAYGQLKSKVSDFQSAMSELVGDDNYNQMRAESSNESLFSANADYLAGATSGNYNIEVESEAEASRWVSENASTEKEVTGSITIQPANSDHEDVTITADAGDTLDNIRAKINEHEDLQGVAYANLVNTGDGEARLTVNAEQTGNENSVSVVSGSVDGNGDVTDKLKVVDGDQIGENTSSLSTSGDLDAKITIDGIEATSSTNTFDNVISGVTLDITPGALNDSEVGTTGTLEVDQDKQAVKDKINDFMGSYNELMTFLNEAKYSSVNEDGEVEGGVLSDESAINSLQSQLRSIIDSPVSGGSDEETNQNHLSFMGIVTNVEGGADGPGPTNGHLKEGIGDEAPTVDPNYAGTRLDEVLDKNFDDVARILGDEDNGYAARLSETANLMTDATRDGLIPTRTEGLSTKVNNLEDGMQDTMDRLDSYEQRLYDQFNAVESTTASLQAQGQQIQAQLGGGGGLASLL
ncbi:flagellar filament capping protein FliD [Marinospirillum sp.]|uniref:flagellar filament capping protein FliD n=1 Tax=Marinospirillum sp. TaxID=2183934 RepID=UPI00384A5921